MGRRYEGGATYSFRSFRRAANQPTDRPTEVTSGASCGGMLRDSVQAAVPNGAGVGAGRGWLGPAGKRIAAREPPKLDYSCHATLNGVTHVRDDRDPVASRGRNTLVRFCSVRFGSDRIGQTGGRMDGWTDERTDVTAFHEVRRSFDLISRLLRQRLPSCRRSSWSS